MAQQPESATPTSARVTGGALRLGRLWGIELRLDYSWFIAFALISWSLASHYFPMAHPEWTPTTTWVLALVTSLLFFASVVAHELAHSVVSRATGVPVSDITLFVFGGAAHLTREPRRARDELLMALAGPAASLLLGAGFGLLWWLSRTAGGALATVTGWLAWINVSLALFNLIPGFPLDGGRVFRALVWGLTGNLRRATTVAGTLGRLVAFGFIFLGLWQVFRGNWTNGLWLAFIGWFLDSAATRSVQSQALEAVLTGHTVREVMTIDCPLVPRRLTLDVLVEQVLLPSGRRCFPVVDDGQLQGLITLHQIKAVPRDRWPTTRVEEVMIPREALRTARPDEQLTTVLERMTAEDINQFPVVAAGQLVGMITRERLLNFIHTRLELE